MGTLENHFVWSGAQNLSSVLLVRGPRADPEENLWGTLKRRVSHQFPDEVWCYSTKAPAEDRKPSPGSIEPLTLCIACRVVQELAEKGTLKAPTLVPVNAAGNA